MSDAKPLLSAWADKSIRESIELKLLAWGNMVMCSCGEKHALMSKEWLDTIKTFISADGSLSEGILKLGAKWYCPAELLKEIRYPDGIIEFIKDRFMPSFARKWWPVRYCVHRVYEMYPEVKFPNHIGTRYVYFGKECDPDAA